MASRDELKTYRDKRDFQNSPEPSGEGSSRRERGQRPIFVVQQHDATNLHDDDGNLVPMSEAYEPGHLVVSLGGKKLRGGYSLERFRGDDQWLLVKMDDDEADARRNPVSTQPRSVLTGRTIDEVAAAGEEG